MLLSEFENKIKNKLNEFDLKEVFPYKENGVLGEVNTFEEVVFKAIFSYNTFEIIEETARFYSINEQRIIREIIRYQKEMDAYYGLFQVERKNRTELTHTEIKNRLNKAYKKNRGFYYIVGLKGYTSTTLHENPVLSPGLGHGKRMGCGNKRKYRLYGKMSKVLPETLRLYDGSNITWSYPIKINGVCLECESIYEVYDLVLRHKEGLTLEKERTFYSSQEKKIIKTLKKIP